MQIPSGIRGLDDLLNGGFPIGRSILLAGHAGAGKTTFGLQFLLKGAENGENGIYIAFDEFPGKIRENMKSFGWNLKKYEDEGTLAILDAISTRIASPTDEKYVEMRPFDINSLIEDIYKLWKKTGAKRLVFDSITSFAVILRDEFEIRKEILRISTALEKLGCTSLFISEVKEGSDDISRFGVEEFLADGVIFLMYAKEGNTYKQYITVRKMKGVNHSKRIYEMEITKNGIVVHTRLDALREV